MKKSINYESKKRVIKNTSLINDFNIVKTLANDKKTNVIYYCYDDKNFYITTNKQTFVCAYDYNIKELVESLQQIQVCEFLNNDKKMIKLVKNNDLKVSVDYLFKQEFKSVVESEQVANIDNYIKESLTGKKHLYINYMDHTTGTAQTLYFKYNIFKDLYKYIKQGVINIAFNNIVDPVLFTLKNGSKLFINSCRWWQL